MGAVRQLQVVAVVGMLGLGSACDPEELGAMVYGEQPASPEESCELSMDNLAGRSFVMLEAMPDRSNRHNHQARAKFFEEDGALKVKYTVKSLGDVYTYECQKVREGKELECAEEPNLQDWCQALETHEEGSCTVEKLEEFGAEGRATRAELEEAVEEGRAMVAKYRDAAEGGDEKDVRAWKQFKLNNNNLGNKLQGLLYVSVDKKRCQANFTDMYMVIFDGERKTDSNPVGTNPFVEVEDPFLWEHCEDGRKLLDLATDERPEPGKVPPKATHELNKPIYYQYYGEEAVEPEEGCTYSYDSYAQWRPVDRDVAVEPSEEGELIWSASHTFTDGEELEMVNPATPIGVFTMVRHKTCGGKQEVINTICNAAKVMVP